MTDHSEFGYDAIMQALRAGAVADLEIIRSHVEGFPDGVDQFIGRRWIINAIDCDSLTTVSWMLTHNVELNFRDEEGYTVLHACLERASAAHLSMMRVLIAAGANVNALGINEWTPLHMAGARSNLDAIELLLDQGADRSIRTTIDIYATPAEEAKFFGKTEAAKLIETYRVK